MIRPLGCMCVGGCSAGVRARRTDRRAEVPTRAGATPALLPQRRGEPAGRSRGVHPADAVLLSQDSGVGKKAKAKSKFALLDDDAEDED
jgi:hypothetical protein